MTPFMVTHAVLAVVLARLSATDDGAVATPIAGRGDVVLEPLVGMFVNTLVLRAGRFGDVVPMICWRRCGRLIWLRSRTCGCAVRGCGGGGRSGAVGGVRAAGAGDVVV